MGKRLQTEGQVQVQARPTWMLRVVALILAMVIPPLIPGLLRADTGSCGGATITLPFSDVMGNIFFCAIAEAYFSGITNGTSPTTYSPSANVPREQMAAFIGRTLDQSLKRGSQRAALNQWWVPQQAGFLGLTAVGDSPSSVQSDGADVWVMNTGGASVSRVRASDGKLLGTWTGVSSRGVLIAMGKVFVSGVTTSGAISQIDPTQAPGPPTLVADGLAGNPNRMAFDGNRFWTANQMNSISRVSLNPLQVTNISTGFVVARDILYDGANVWVSDSFDSKIKKLDSNGSILSTVDVGQLPNGMTFDGTNIWVGCLGSVSVVRVKDSQGSPLSSPFLLATLTANVQNFGRAAFDGERVLVTNDSSVSLWKAADLTPLGTFPVGATIQDGGACSDGLNFWIALGGANALARF
jgi:hypothetical protein